MNKPFWVVEPIEAAAERAVKMPVAERSEADLVRRMHAHVTQRAMLPKTVPYTGYFEENDRIQCALFDLHFPRIDVDFLRWRKKGKPVFAYFGFEHVNGDKLRYQMKQECSFSNHSYGYGEDDLYRWYEDIVSGLSQEREKAGYRTTYSISTKAPVGFLPADVQRLIFRWKPRARPWNHHGRPYGFRKPIDETHDAPPCTFRELYVVCEAQEWDERVIVTKDPLLIGSYRGQSVTPLFWLLAKFDMTPMEAYVAAEWSHGK
jgi:hypothetical protein